MKRLRTTCPICGTSTDEAEILFHRDFSPAATLVPFRRYDVCLCPSCGLFYAGNMEESMPLDEYYAMLSRYDGDSFVLSEAVKGVYRRTADFLEQHIEKNARILDIGCAFGGLLAELQQRDFTHLAGLEYAERNCQFVEKTLRIPAHRGGLGHLPKSLLGEHFDLIILSGVLEHLFDLRSAIAECNSLLDENGKIFILTPDVEQFPLHNDLYQEFSVEHINYFDIDSLSALFACEGLTCCATIQDTVPMFGLAGNRYSLWSRNALQKKNTAHGKGKHAMQNYMTNAAALSDVLRERLSGGDSENNFYVWGAGTQTAMLVQLGILDIHRICGIVDGNQNYHGRTAYGHPIEAPDDLYEKQGIPILIASQYAQRAIEHVIRDKMRLSNPIIKLFPEEHT